jgi:hypothetical protein
MDERLKFVARLAMGSAAEHSGIFASSIHATGGVGFAAATWS